MVDLREPCVVLEEYMTGIVVLSEHVPKYLHVYKSSISHIVVHQSIGGVMVSIAAFQAVDLGSIPGQCIFVHSVCCLNT